MQTTFEPGTIVRLKTPLGDEYSAIRIEHVIILQQPSPPFDAARPELRIAPIAPDPQYASSLDVMLRADEAQLPRDVAAEIWNQRAILVEDVDAIVARVASPMVDVIFNVHNSMLGLEDFNPRFLTYVGKPITSEDDVRMTYQIRRAELAEGLSQAADAVWCVVDDDASSDDFGIEFSVPLQGYAYSFDVDEDIEYLKPSLRLDGDSPMQQWAKHTGEHPNPISSAA